MAEKKTYESPEIIELKEIKRCKGSFTP